MVKKYILFTLLSLYALYSQAQHCQWDGSAFVMLDIKAGNELTIQKIYLLDSSGSIVLTKYYYGYDRVEQDTARFWKNPPSDAEYIPGNHRTQHFPFAKDYYVLPFSWSSNTRPYRVLVLYKSGQTVITKDFPVPDDHVHVLCTTNKELWDGKNNPVIIKL